MKLKVLCSSKCQYLMFNLLIPLSKVSLVGCIPELSFPWQIPEPAVKEVDMARHNGLRANRSQSIFTSTNCVKTEDHVNTLPGPPPMGSARKARPGSLGKPTVLSAARAAAP